MPIQINLYVNALIKTHFHQTALTERRISCSISSTIRLFRIALSVHTNAVRMINEFVDRSKNREIVFDLLSARRICCESIDFDEIASKTLMYHLEYDSRVKYFISSIHQERKRLSLVQVEGLTSTF